MNKNGIEFKIRTIFELANGQVGMGQGLKNIEFLDNGYLFIESNHSMSPNMIKFLVKNLHKIINADIINVFRKNTVLIFKLNDIWGKKMTVILASKDLSNDSIYIGSDLLSSTEYNTYKKTKIIKKEDKDGNLIVFAVAGYTWLVDYIKNYDLKIINDVSHSPYNYIKKVLFCMYDDLLENALIPIYDEEKDTCSNIIIIYKNNIYSIQSNFAILEEDNYEVIGSGYPTATGAFLASKMAGLSIKKSIESALKITIDNNKSCGLGYEIYKIKNNEIKLIKSKEQYMGVINWTI